MSHIREEEHDDDNKPWETAKKEEKGRYESVGGEGEPKEEYEYDKGVEDGSKEVDEGVVSCIVFFFGDEDWYEFTAWFDGLVGFYDGVDIFYETFF